ncbi:MAG: EAL domain-containing protein [Firmicutes bacterium]|nr:EAL domain-containing protein [Bacillota bacterium]
MEKIIFFNYCAIPIYSFILISAFVRGATRGRSNRYFILLNAMSLTATVLDILANRAFPERPLTTAGVYAITLFEYGYFLLHNLTMPIYQIYLIYVMKTEFLFKNKFIKFLLIGLSTAIVLLLITNPITHWIFTVTPDVAYSRGSHIILLYPIVFIFFLGGMIFLIKYRKLIDGWKWLAYLSLYLMDLAAVVVQYLSMRYLVEMFCTALAFLFIVLIVYRPEESVDPAVLLPNWKEYRRHIRNILMTKQHVKIAVIKFINANNIRTYLGEERYNRFLRKISEPFIDSLMQTGLDFDMYFEAPGSIYVVFKDVSDDFDISQKLFSIYRSVRYSFQEIEHTGARLIPRVLIMNCPEDLDNFDDIIHLGHEFYGLTSYYKTVTNASDIIGSKSFKIESNMDSILERAITENRLEMYYQPIYSLKEKRFTSAEALIRLKDREYGFISPGIFIPAAEARGLILPIGDFVVEEVFKFISENDLKKYGIDHIEPNLSVAQCLQPELAEKIKSLEEKYNIDPKDINFEITETFFDNIGEIMDRNINRIRDMGYAFSLDDYGTGYSNIQRVSRLPFSVIKIDKSLIDIIDTPDGLAIIKNTINMMKDIRKEIVAEGVEDEKTVNLLNELGCDYIQGFYFAKPMPKDDFLQFIKENNKGTR